MIINRIAIIENYSAQLTSFGVGHESIHPIIITLTEVHSHIRKDRTSIIAEHVIDAIDECLNSSIVGTSNHQRTSFARPEVFSCLLQVVYFFYSSSQR